MKKMMLCVVLAAGIAAVSYAAEAKGSCKCCAEKTECCKTCKCCTEKKTDCCKKDAEKKTTPLLVPYNELAESEKEYDRNTALETIKLIIKMGYRIE